MARTIGLDVGTNAVRAVEVNLGRSGPVVERVGQVALPYGAVVAGEVVDAAAVAAALRRLWKEVGFSSRRVVVGVANARVVARVAELPDMPDAEIRSSLQYQVQDLIPIPVEDAVLDYQVLERTPAVEGTGAMLRLLLVAAHRDMLRSLLASLEGAGLEPARVDLVPFALIRALYDGSDLGLGDEADDPAHGLPQAIVGVGAGVTNVVIHERGLPRFVRTLPTGGNAVAEALSSELDLDLDTAEGLKRSLDTGHLVGPDGDRAVAVVSSALSPVLEDIRGTLDYYVSSPEGGPLGRVVVTGGGARVPELCRPASGSSLGVPVAHRRPARRDRPGAHGVPAGGPASRGGPPHRASRPRPLRRAGGSAACAGSPCCRPRWWSARAQRRQQSVAAAALAGLAALLLGLFLLRNGRVADARQGAEREEATTRTLQQQEGTFAPVEAIQADVAGRRATAVVALSGDVAWTRVLQEIAGAMPNDVWLTSFDGQTDATSGAQTMTFSAMGFDQTSTARWIQRLEEVPLVDDVWVSSSTSSGDAGRPLVTFSSDASLTEAAGSDRADRLPGGEGR